MEAYEVWRTVMYMVGVFVTCNVGGLALLSVKNRLTKVTEPPAPPEGAAVRMGVRTHKGMKVISDPEEIAHFLSKLSDADKADMRPVFDHVRQTFEDIQRQIDTPEAEPGKTADEKED